jgi:hypothetical protein
MAERVLDSNTPPTTVGKQQEKYCKIWLENLRVDGEMDLKEQEFGSMEYIDLIQERDRWRALVNAITNIPVP